MEWIDAEPGSPEITRGEVHVWRFRLEDVPAAHGALTADERARAEGMTSADAARAFVASQSALRATLAGYTGSPAPELRFSRGKHGKPALADVDSGAVHFNVTHSGDWGLIAVADVPVGVDVERISSGRDTAALQRRFFTDGERALLRQRTISRGDGAFFVIWSRKEAYLKATGFGLSAPFSRVDSSTDELPELDEDGAQLPGDMPWSARELDVDELHPAAVVARARQFTLRLFTLRRPDFDRDR